jgi:hypothetical protein
MMEAGMPYRNFLVVVGVLFFVLAASLFSQSVASLRMGLPAASLVVACIGIACAVIGLYCILKATGSI